MTAAVPGPREDIDWSAHRGSCRVFYAERRCTCGAVPDPFRDQLAEREEFARYFAWAYGGEEYADSGSSREHWLEVADDFLARPFMRAYVDARVQAAANQRAAEELYAAVREDRTTVAKLSPVERLTCFLVKAEDLFARAAALASPAPAPHGAADEEADRG